MKCFLLKSIFFLGLCGQAGAQVQSQIQDAEERERSRHEMREVMRSERRALAAERGPELVPTSKGSER